MRFKGLLVVGAHEDEGSFRRWSLVAGIGILVIAALSVLANFVVLENLVMPGDHRKRQQTSWPQRACSSWGSPVGS